MTINESHLGRLRCYASHSLCRTHFGHYLASSVVLGWL